MDKVVILTPVYNEHPKMLSVCIRSVMEQTYDNTHMIVYRDGGEPIDLSAEIKSYGNKLTFIDCNENKMRAEARNECLRALPKDADWFSFLDSDDVLGKDAIQFAMNNKKKDTEFIRIQNNYEIYAPLKRHYLKVYRQRMFVEENYCETNIKQIKTLTFGKFPLSGLLHNLYLRNIDEITSVLFPTGANAFEEFAWTRWVRENAQKVLNRELHYVEVDGTKKAHGHCRFMATDVSDAEKYAHEPRYSKKENKVIK